MLRLLTCGMWALLVAAWLAVGVTYGDVFTIGYLTGSQRLPGDQEYNRPGLMISGAISLAVSEVNAGELGKRGHRLNFTVAETFGEEVNSIRQTAKLWTSNVSAYVGPQETCVHEGRMAAAFNLPMISYPPDELYNRYPVVPSGALHWGVILLVPVGVQFCRDYETSDKRDFPTFARTRPPDTQISKSVAAVLLSFNWTQVAFFYLNSADSEFEKIATTIMSTLKESGITVRFLRWWDTPYHHGYSENPFFRLVKDTFQDTRVYIILGYHYEHLGLMVAMQELHLFDKGEYWVVGVDIEQYDQENPAKYLRGLLRDETDLVAQKAYRNYLGVVASAPLGYENFKTLVNSYMEKPPFNFPNPLTYVGGMKRIRPEAAYLYDAVRLYARALLSVLDDGDNPRNGTAIIEAVKGCHYESAMGYVVYMDENGDAEGNYTLLARQAHHYIPGVFGLYPTGVFTRSTNGSHIPELHLTGNIDWVNGKPPIAEPPCGFRGEKCISHTGEIVAGVAGGILLILAVVSLVLYRNWKYEQELDSLLWKVDFKDIQVNDENKQAALGTKVSRSIHPLIRTSQVSLSSNPDADFRYSTIYTPIGIYKGRVFAIKKVHKKSIDITREMKKELKMMRDLRHDNLNSFIGACTDPPNICIITEYCTRGSLKDILENEDVKLDNMFIASLVGDIIRGMMYLHDSHVRVHGNLKASNCLVDSRWVVKVSDFGLHQIKHYEFIEDVTCSLYQEDFSEAIKRKYEGLLYRAPELLRAPPLACRGTQKGDIYSFGIILYELHARNGPFGEAGGLLTASETLRRVTYPEQGKPPHRPPLELLEHSFDFVRDCLVECWAENPDERPDFKTVRAKLRPLRKGMKPNIFDNMMAMMEKYANNLEALVDERTDQLSEEKKKTEALLYEMLPRYVAEQLKRGNKVEAEGFDCVTIYFSDIVGFTAMSAESTPLQVVDFLNDLYTCFDSTIENYDVYKVETIGDAYMVVSGLPIRNGAQHAGEIASMSLHLLEAVKRFRIRHRPNDNLMLRIGLHCGPVCAGVVGLKMPRYCLFGDTVNTASRMESTGTPLKIHCSLECKSLLDKLGGYKLVERGMVRMKGKGDKLTYWLVGEDPGKRSIRAEERSIRRAEASGKPRPPSTHEPNGCPGVPRSSLKNKSSANCFLARSPLSRCSSLESPKRLRFASGNLLQFHQYQQRCVSKDPLLEVIADNSPCKKPSNGLLTAPDLTADCPKHDMRAANSCPCIEKCCSSTCTATFSKKQCSFVARFQEKNNSVPVLFPTSGLGDRFVHNNEAYVSSAPTSPCSEVITVDLTFSLKGMLEDALANAGNEDDVSVPLLTSLGDECGNAGEEIETPV